MVRLRPLSRFDRRDWVRIREANQLWLGPWDASTPPGEPGRPRSFAVDYATRFVGQLTVNNIVRGSAQIASIGYWIDQEYAGRGIIPRAVAMAIDHCFTDVGLHRIEIAIRPENVASLRVVEKLGIQEYGYARRYLHIDGDWRDHRLFAINREEVPFGMLRKLDSQQSQE